MDGEKHQKRDGRSGKVEIDDKPYRQHDEEPVVAATIWQSLDESSTFWFVETDVARRRLEPAGHLLGRIPPAVVSELRAIGYEVVH
ncbi:MAG: hypothetical protein ABEJ31_11805 [Haloarculaceae archaeon]